MLIVIRIITGMIMMMTMMIHSWKWTMIYCVSHATEILTEQVGHQVVVKDNDDASGYIFLSLVVVFFISFLFLFFFSRVVVYLKWQSIVSWSCACQLLSNDIDSIWWRNNEYGDWSWNKFVCQRLKKGESTEAYRNETSVFIQLLSHRFESLRLNKLGRHHHLHSFWWNRKNDKALVEWKKKKRMSFQ